MAIPLALGNNPKLLHHGHVVLVAPMLHGLAVGDPNDVCVGKGDPLSQAVTLNRCRMSGGD
jgi:hypothetical protein